RRSARELRELKIERNDFHGSQHSDLSGAGCPFRRVSRKLAPDRPGDLHLLAEPSGVPSAAECRSRCWTISSSAERIVGWSATSERKASRSSTSRREAFVTRALAVRGTCWRRAISPK